MGTATSRTTQLATIVEYEADPNDPAIAGLPPGSYRPAGADPRYAAQRQQASCFWWGPAALFLEASPLVRSFVWRRVGEGQGKYEKVMTYDYVGEGGGSFEREDTVNQDSQRLRPVCAMLLCLLVAAAVALVVALVGNGMDPTTTTMLVIVQKVAPEPRSCSLWGDPHVQNFDHGFASFLQEGDYWIVKSKDLHVQGRYLPTPYTHGLAAMHSLTVGGPFLSGHVVQVGPMDGGDITYDGARILERFPETFDAGDAGTLSYDGEGQLVDPAQSKLQKHIVHMSLPDGVRLEVFRWANHINVRLVMTPRPGGQEGSCGNFNNDPGDDTPEEISARGGGRVAPADLLFSERGGAAGVPRGIAPRKPLTLGDCPSERRAAAEGQCTRARPGLSGQMLQSCAFDVCFGGAQYAREDAVAVG